MKLVFGVIDILYGAGPGKGVVSTGEVAGYLENKYHIMRVFYEEHEQEIEQDVNDFFAGLLESLALGMPMLAAEQRIKAGILDQIEDRFHHFIDTEELLGILPEKFHSQAAKKGINHSLKHPYKNTNPARAAFVDTGHYRASFRAWFQDADRELFAEDASESS